ncbi:MAG: hypothetical protein M1813_002974 [Trichoglossum hirsutum]|jgi:hypothetical protein|nr:MAG: hypothetical protein M1813_002974 [Trichoglossum hirsutum]
MASTRDGYSTRSSSSSRRSSSHRNYGYPYDRRSAPTDREYNSHEGGLVVYQDPRRNEWYRPTRYERGYGSSGDYDGRERERGYSRQDDTYYDVARRGASSSSSRDMVLSSAQYEREVGGYRGGPYGSGMPAQEYENRYLNRAATTADGSHYSFNTNAYPSGTQQLNLEVQGRNHQARLSLTMSPRAPYTDPYGRSFIGAPGPSRVERMVDRLCP